MRIEDFFAYESFRPNQKELALRIYDSCMHGEMLLTEAMSGFGKTAAVLSGVVCAARERDCRVVYACRTKRQILRVVDEISLLQRKQRVRAASMFSKFDYCLLKRTSPKSIPQESFGWYCSFNTSNNLCSYFLNVTLLGTELDHMVQRVCYGVPTHKDLLRESENIHVCPYELVRLAMAQAEILVVPYQYLLDSKAKPVLFDRNSVEPARTILVIDEVHNLRDFLKSSQSMNISLTEFEGAVSEARELLMNETASSLNRLNEEVQSAVRNTPHWHIDRESFIKKLSLELGEMWLQNLAFELSACSEVAWHSVAYGRRLPFLILKVGDFLNKLIASSQYTMLTKWENTLGLVNTNPVESLAHSLRQFNSAVLVSATINPSEIFLRSLGIDANSIDTYAVQTAPLATVKTVIDTGVTTMYKSRTPEMYAKIAGKIVSVVTSVKNGVGVFAPSYSVLGPIHERVCKALPDRHVVLETRGLSNQEAGDLMDAFRSGLGSILFAVQGGRFSEGEDFKGNSMDATVVVGLSLPPPSPPLYAEYAFLRRRGETDSYLMLSLLPALRKAFQAAGRHLRSPGKKGLVFLLDHRYDSAVVNGLMPSWLKGNITVGDFTPLQTESIVHEFWNN